MNRITCTLILLALTVSSCTQQSTSTIVKEPPIIIDSFFVTYQNEGSAKALVEIFQTNPRFLKESKDEIEEVSDKLNKITRDLDKYHGFEFICQRAVGIDLKQYSCLVKYEYQPIRFRFTFYKTNNKWKLINFQFDDELTDELNDASRVSLLQENW